QAVKSAAQSLPDAMQQLDQAITGGNTAEIIVKGIALGQKVAALAIAVTDTARNLHQLAQNDGSLSAAQKASVQQSAGKFFPRLAETFIIRLVEQKLPQLAATLNLVGIAENVLQNE